MRYKEAKPSNTFSKNSSENHQRHFRYRLFKFPVFFIQREITGGGKKFKFSLTSFDENFELKKVVVLLRHLCKTFMKSKMTFVLYKASSGNAVFN